MPSKLNIPSKSNFVSRPSVPSSQKQSATEFNQLVSAVNSNYERLMLRWSTDIIVNVTIPAGQYLLFTDEGIYRVHTAFNVGSPITWDASKVTQIGGSGTGLRPAFSDWDPSGDSMPLDADAIGSGTAGAILKGDQVIFTDVFPDGGNDWPIDTIGTAKQNSPTSTAHWRLF